MYCNVLLFTMISRSVWNFVENLYWFVYTFFVFSRSFLLFFHIPTSSFFSYSQLSVVVLFWYCICCTVLFYCLHDLALQYSFYTQREIQKECKKIVLKEKLCYYRRIIIIFLFSLLYVFFSYSYSIVRNKGKERNEVKDILQFGYIKSYKMIHGMLISVCIIFTI